MSASSAAAPSEPAPHSHGAPTAPGADRVERLLAELNPPQREAVRHGDGPLLVLAGAGSGKTRVLTHRIAYLLATGMARPGEILAITFTNKAAGEMRERVEQLVGRATRAMWVTTFHSACARMLRVEAERLGYSRGFTIYDEADSLRMIKRCMDELEVDPKRFPPRALRAQISGAKNRLLDVDGYRETHGSVFEQTAADVFALYERRMLEANAMDFDDLLVRTVNVIELFEEARERWRRTFRHVLVDEYQDTNRAQYRLLQLLCEEHGNLMVVGDESQSIYGFRHADIGNILDFERDFAAAEVVKLEQNYRSTQTILSTANAVIERNRQRIEKRLWTEIGGGEPVQLSELGDEHEEARWVAGEVERLVDEEGISRAQIAVFYRTNAMSRVLEDTLVRFELPYQVIGGTKFYERAEIKDAVAYLSLLIKPFRSDLLRPRRQLAPARDRQHQPGPARRAREHDRVADLGGRRSRRGGARHGGGGDQGDLPLSRDRGGAARPRPRRARRPRPRGGARRKRLPRGPGGGANGRGGGADREPAGADRRRGRVRRQPRARGCQRDVRRWRSSCSRSRCSPSRTSWSATRRW